VRDRALDVAAGPDDRLDEKGLPRSAALVHGARRWRSWISEVA
jgi:hypothetical protein